MSLGETLHPPPLPCLFPAETAGNDGEVVEISGTGFANRIGVSMAVKGVTAGVEVVIERPLIQPPGVPEGASTVPVVLLNHTLVPITKAVAPVPHASTPTHPIEPLNEGGLDGFLPAPPSGAALGASDNDDDDDVDVDGDHDVGDGNDGGVAAAGSHRGKPRGTEETLFAASVPRGYSQVETHVWRV